MSCIGAPVYDNTGKAVASVSVSGMFGFIEKDKLEDIIIEVKKTGMEVSQRMGYVQNPIKY
jgi:DNA-binding IclR family transcriptional regulator